MPITLSDKALAIFHEHLERVRETSAAYYALKHKHDKAEDDYHVACETFEHVARMAFREVSE